MHPKTRSHNGYLLVTESRETIQKHSFGPQEVDWTCSLRKNKTQLRKHKVVHFMHPKTRYNNLYLPATESRETTQKHCFGPKEVDWACSLRKTRRNFGSTKWCILCTPKPVLTMGTSRQRNRGKPPKNLVLGLKKWIGQDRSEKNKTQLRKHKVLHFMHPKTRSHNLYLPATESRETTQKLSFGPKQVDWACSLRKNKTQLR